VQIKKHWFLLYLDYLSLASACWADGLLLQKCFLHHHLTPKKPKAKVHSQIFHMGASEAIIKNHYHRTPNQTTSAQDKKDF
jgi:hypothetical protein